jgi:hypothetical protein
VLKGALLLRGWLGAETRPTRDIDLLGSPQLDAAKPDVDLVAETDVAEASCELGTESVNRGFATERLRWRALLGKGGLAGVDRDLAVIVGEIRRFAEPPLSAVRERHDFERHWPPGGEWR